MLAVLVRLLLHARPACAAVDPLEGKEGCESIPGQIGVCCTPRSCAVQRALFQERP